MLSNRRVWVVAAVLLLALGAAWIVRSGQQQRQLLIEMEGQRQKAEQAFAAADWPDQLALRLADWKISVQRLKDRSLRKTLLGEILAMEQKNKMLARPGIRNSLDAVARALAEVNDRHGPGTNVVTK
jgi:hypothetical protein